MSKDGKKSNEENKKTEEAKKKRYAMVIKLDRQYLGLGLILKVRCKGAYAKWNVY